MDRYKEDDTEWDAEEQEEEILIRTMSQSLAHVLAALWPLVAAAVTLESVGVWIRATALLGHPPRGRLITAYPLGAESTGKAAFRRFGLR